MLDDGRYASISDIAKTEKIDRGYVGSILRLTLLAPDIVEAILNGQQSAELMLPKLLKPFPLQWHLQREAFGTASPSSAVNEGLHLTVDPPKAARPLSAA